MNIHYKIMKASAEGIVFRGQVFENKTDLAEAIIGEVAAYKEIRKSEIRSSSRKAILVICRRVISYILYEKVGLTYERIGKLLGDRDHSTTRHACEFLKDRWNYLNQFPVDEDLLNHLNSKLTID